MLEPVLVNGQLITFKFNFRDLFCFLMSENIKATSMVGQLPTILMSNLVNLFSYEQNIDLCISDLLTAYWTKGLHLAPLKHIFPTYTSSSCLYCLSVLIEIENKIFKVRYSNEDSILIINNIQSKIF